MRLRSRPDERDLETQRITVRIKHAVTKVSKITIKLGCDLTVLSISWLYFSNYKNKKYIRVYMSFVH